ncbi:MAG TPA: NAD(+) kinase [Methylophilus sp.]|nr:NAD(+) kinase [Methylophilus sp.]
MTQAFNSIGIVGKYMNHDALQQMQSDLADLAHHLQSKNISVWVEQNTAEHAHLKGFSTVPLADIGARADMVIVMGGDGTMLSVARALVQNPVPLVGINRGRFGFLTDLRAEEMLSSIDRILVGDFQRETRMFFNAQVFRQDKLLHAGVAMNDVVVKSCLRLLEFEVHIDGKFLHKQRADGLIVSTPTGTTAYALSAGGPILHPNVEAIALVPVSPHTLSNRPIAVNSGSRVEVTVLQADDAQVSFDGQIQLDLEHGDKVLIQRAEQMVTLLHPANYCYFDMLRNKLNWS